jgi:transcriptional regulator with XRE-family HTH domain
MTIGKKVKKALAKGDFIPAKSRMKLSSGDSVRIMRELQDYSQNELAQITGIPQSTISGIESGRINLGVERAKMLARALKIHPAVLLFPGWDTAKESAA